MRILILLAILITSIVAYADTCQKVVIAGDSNWPPYIIEQEDPEDITYYVSGVGIELAAQIFKELDLLITGTAYSDRQAMLDALQNGDLDLVVSTYAYDDLDIIADILSPAYFNDPITVATDVETAAKLKHWEDLIGLYGIVDASFALDNATADYFTKYLQVTAKGTLPEALLGLQNGTYGYVVGSEAQLNYAIKANRLSDKIAVATNLVRSGDGIHMAFARNSACKQYAPYLSMRLQESANNGTVRKLVDKYSQ